MSLEGIDVSYAQSHTPSLVGKSFAFAKATEGTAKDPLFAYHLANFRKAGVVAGAYHYGVKGSIVPIALQVSAFLAVAGNADLLALDVEGATEPSNSEAQAFINGVRAHGRKCGLYHSLSGFPSAVSADFRWIAKYSSTPPSIAWDFWQYTNMGTQYGLDLDRYAHDKAALLALAGKVVHRDMPLVSPAPDPVAAYIVDIAAGGSAYYDLACTLVASPNPMLALAGVVTYGTAKRPTDQLLMRAFAHPSGYVAYVGANKCSNVRPKTTPTGTQTVTVTGQGITVVGPK